MVGHNSYQTGTGNMPGGYLPSNPVGVSSYNPSSTQYNSLGHHYANKSSLMGTAMNSLGMGTALGQSSVLGG